MGLARIGMVAMVLAGLAGCAAQTEVVEAPAEMPDIHTVMGRYPARRSGILIAQNAALQEGRAMCETQGRRFRPVGSIAGEDPSTGEAVYAMRFRCLPPRRAQAGTPPDTPRPGAPRPGAQMPETQAPPRSIANGTVRDPGAFVAGDSR